MSKDLTSGDPLLINNLYEPFISSQYFIKFKNNNNYFNNNNNNNNTHLLFIIL